MKEWINQDSSKRLKSNTYQVVDYSKEIVFEFDGITIKAYEGDSVASALTAAGIDMISRSFKYHRPRGLLCVSGRCPNCMMNVDGTPNVRICTIPAKDGMMVRHQNAWPSLKNDILRILDKLDRFMPVGFYYKMLHRPKILWKLSEPIIRKIAGLGRIDIYSVPQDEYFHEHTRADVAVIGGGPAGLSAAISAAKSGASVTLVDDQPNLGGHLRFDSTQYSNISSPQKEVGFDICTSLVETAKTFSNITFMTNATAFGFYQDNLIGVMSDSLLTKIRAKSVILATGSYEIPLTYQGNDKPGILLCSGAIRLIHLYGVKPGTKAVVATTTDQGYQAAYDLLNAGVRVVALADTRPQMSSKITAMVDDLKAKGIPILNSHSLVRANGKTRVTEVAIREFQNGSPVGTEKVFKCDTVCMSGGFQPASFLIQQTGSNMTYDHQLGESIPSILPTSLYVAGDVTGIRSLNANIIQGRLAGIKAASLVNNHDNNDINEQIKSDIEELRNIERDYRLEFKWSAGLPVPSTKKKAFVCYCEDITSKDISDAIEEGFQDIQTLKRYSTVTMGPCQGKMCLKPFTDIAAERTKSSLDEIGVTTSRPPLTPIPLGALAGQSHIPLKITPLHQKHLGLAAPIVEAGSWQRAYSYGSPLDEVMAVRNGVGIIDVSTLGKLEVKGRDAAVLMDKVYTQTFSNLRIGRIRYGVLCTDSGTILDDGTVMRKSDTHFFVTTTTGNVELIEEWFKWWMAGTGLCAHITNVTSAYAAINVAGPKARETLSKITQLNLEPKSFRYMRSKEGLVANIPTLLLRIGFVGETGWELHFPAEYAEFMWDQLMIAGEEFNIKPFGLEAQRILRLEKGHIIVNQDTDAVTNPLESNLSWAVNFDKSDFIGRNGLLGIKDRGLKNQLVGFIVNDGNVPKDGSPIVSDDSRPIGRVTSSRYSPTINSGFGLAWVPIDQAQQDEQINILIDDAPVKAKVTLKPIYDPEGKRLRE